MISFLFLITLTMMSSAAIHENSIETPLSIPNWIRSNGYPCEEHKVVTPDGYILAIHRIPHKPGVDKAPKNQSVFLMHGILSSSADWIMTGREEAFAYILSDAGYDVWMGNARGNTQSRNHTHLDPDKNSTAFWDFSWHEIGYYDLPTMIDFVLDTTGESQLLYVGHSQGTTTFYVMTSMRPEYNAKIKAHFSLAPIAFMNHMTSPLLQIMAEFRGPLSALLDLLGVDEFLPNDRFISAVDGILCGDQDLTQILCKNTLFAICGFDSSELNATMLPELFEYTPAGSSTKQFLHYGQEINSGYFRQFDYGLFGNLFKYKSIAPPDYDLKKITAPMYLFYSHNDWLAAEIDVLTLYNKLPNVERFLVTDGIFNHLDYVYGIHAKGYVYDRVINLMMRYNN